MCGCDAQRAGLTKPTIERGQQFRPQISAALSPRNGHDNCGFYRLTDHAWRVRNVLRGEHG